jgi:hypothetical protein
MMGIFAGRPSRGRRQAAATRSGPDPETLGPLADLLRLILHLAWDLLLPREIRIRLWLLAACVALSSDLIPDFIPNLC